MELYAPPECISIRLYNTRNEEKKKKLGKNQLFKAYTN